MRSVLLSALVAAFAVAACNEAPRVYRECPPGVDPSSYDCVRVRPDAGTPDGGGTPDADDPDGGETPDGGTLDTSITPDGDIPDGCVPSCGTAECGPDGCGGICGRCDRGELCSAGGRCVPREGGGDTCRQIIECTQGCFTDDCWVDCVADGTPQAQELFGAAVECIEVNCAHLTDDEDAYAQCQEEQCGDLLIECLGGDVPGELNCPMILDCLVGCDNDVCLDQCFLAGTREARREFESLYRCVEADGGCQDVGSVEEWIACVQGICPDEAGACWDTDVPIPTFGCSEGDFARLEDMGAELASVLVECGWSCADADGNVRVECAGLCMEGALGLTSACGACTGQLSDCMVEKCGDLCDEPTSPDCEECTVSTCQDDFLVCAGTGG